jgi:hypothetical protein
MRIFADPADRVDRALADQLVDADMLELVIDTDDLLAHMEIVTHTALLKATGATWLLLPSHKHSRISASE